MSHRVITCPYTVSETRTCTILVSVKSSTPLRPPGSTAVVLLPAQPACTLPSCLATITSATLPEESSLHVTVVTAEGMMAAALIEALRLRRLGIVVLGSSVTAGSSTAGGDMSGSSLPGGGRKSGGH